MARFKLRSLFILVTISALVLFWSLEPEEIRNNPFLVDPIGTTFTTRANGDLFTDFNLYSKGAYGILEFGNLRIAVKGKAFKGTSSGRHDVRLSGHAKIIDHEIIGNGIKFVRRTDSEGTHFEFVGLSFKVVDSEVNLLGKSVKADGQPKLVLVRDGKAVVYTSLIQ